MGHDFKEFMEGTESIPANIYQQTLKYAEYSLNPSKLLLKFYTLNFIGAFATLYICPQYGFGPYGGEFGIINQIMNLGPVLCGMFCSLIFFTGGNLLSFLSLNKVERKWIINHEYSVLTPYVAIIFMLGMTLKHLSPGHIHHDVIPFYTSWLLSAMIACVMFHKLFKLRMLRIS